MKKISLFLLTLFISSCSSLREKKIASSDFPASHPEVYNCLVKKVYSEDDFYTIILFNHCYKNTINIPQGQKKPGEEISLAVAKDEHDNHDEIIPIAKNALKKKQRIILVAEKELDDEVKHWNLTDNIFFELASNVKDLNVLDIYSTGYSCEVKEVINYDELYKIVTFNDCYSYFIDTNTPRNRLDGVIQLGVAKDVENPEEFNKIIEMAQNALAAKKRIIFKAVKDGMYWSLTVNSYFEFHQK